MPADRGRPEVIGTSSSGRDCPIGDIVFCRPQGSAACVDLIFTLPHQPGESQPCLGLLCSGLPLRSILLLEGQGTAGPSHYGY
jgi:hypothetical protein